MISALIIYTQFFSRIVISKQVDITYVKKGVPYITLFGFLLGSLTAGFYALCQLFLPGQIAWILYLLADLLLTGGFHLDALADTADGLFSSRKKERMLEIMKDSRIGSNGVLALILYYAFMISIYPYLPHARWILIISLATIGKAGLALQLYHMVYAREKEGSGNFFVGTKTIHIVLAQFLPIAQSLVAFHWKGALAYSFVLVGAIVYRQFVYKKIDGHTGDTLGAFVEMAQVLYLLGLIL
ncbi:adenosylcobinamide-GDP ribazoletransferase [Streptococcus catagoni]|uniref:adenosylcobinamide-GDP ribazoletransferase n=1 Tax=Streptococcus catagoni TaxID=2654874 RepID=UPI00140D5CD6|nr:adenosylcobinamide-GDP ribazoletransferase [Streptococcus catagoni]